MDSETFYAETSRLDDIAGVRLPDGEQVRTRRVGGRLRAYWTVYVSGYSPSHGGATLTLRWESIRHGVTGELVTAQTPDELRGRLAELAATGDLSVPVLT